MNDLTRPDPTLLPCPFCGGSAAADSQFGREWWVECDDCQASTGGAEANRADAIAAWNRRVASACASAGPLLTCGRCGTEPGPDDHCFCPKCGAVLVTRSDCASAEPEKCQACGEGGLTMRFSGRSFYRECSHCHGELVDQTLSECNVLLARASSEAVAWRRRESCKWDKSGHWVYYEAKAWDDCEPLYASPAAPAEVPQTKPSDHLAANGGQDRQGLDSGWQSIDSAPKDGTRILLRWKYRPARVGWWTDEESGTGWKCDGDLVVPAAAYQADATDWQPVPADPSTAAVPPGLDGIDSSAPPSLQAVDTGGVAEVEAPSVRQSSNQRDEKE
jgi:Lar family restriction alleviation protein